MSQRKTTGAAAVADYSRHILTHVKNVALKRSSSKSRGGSGDLLGHFSQERSLARSRLMVTLGQFSQDPSVTKSLFKDFVEDMAKVDPDELRRAVQLYRRVRLVSGEAAKREWRQQRPRTIINYATHPLVAHVVGNDVFKCAVFTHPLVNVAFFHVDGTLTSLGRQSQRVRDFLREYLDVQWRATQDRVLMTAAQERWMRFVYVADTLKLLERAWQRAEPRDAHGPLWRTDDLDKFNHMVDVYVKQRVCLERVVQAQHDHRPPYLVTEEGFVVSPLELDERLTPLADPQCPLEAQYLGVRHLIHAFDDRWADDTHKRVLGNDAALGLGGNALTLKQVVLHRYGPATQDGAPATVPVVQRRRVLVVNGVLEMPLDAWLALHQYVFQVVGNPAGHEHHPRYASHVATRRRDDVAFESVGDSIVPVDGSLLKGLLTRPSHGPLLVSPLTLSAAADESTDDPTEKTRAFLYREFKNRVVLTHQTEHDGTSFNCLKTDRLRVDGERWFGLCSYKRRKLRRAQEDRDTYGTVPVDYGGAEEKRERANVGDLLLMVDRESGEYKRPAARPDPHRGGGEDFRPDGVHASLLPVERETQSLCTTPHAQAYELAHNYDWSVLRRVRVGVRVSREGRVFVFTQHANEEPAETELGSVVEFLRVLNTSVPYLSYMTDDFEYLYKRTFSHGQYERPYHKQGRAVRPIVSLPVPTFLLRERCQDRFRLDDWAHHVPRTLSSLHKLSGERPATRVSVDAYAPPALSTLRDHALMEEDRLRRRPWTFAPFTNAHLYAKLYVSSLVVKLPFGESAQQPLYPADVISDTQRFKFDRALLSTEARLNEGRSVSSPAVSLRSDEHVRDTLRIVLGLCEALPQPLLYF